MAYTKSQFVLSPDTAPSNLGNAVQRSGIADVAAATTNIIAGLQNVQGTKIQNESRELSLHTQILGAQAADDRRVIAEREAAAARAKASADTDALQAYLKESAALGLAYEDALRTAGDDPELQRAARDAYVTGLDNSFTVLPETVQDRTFTSHLQTVTGAESTYRSNIHAIDVGQFNQQVESFTALTSGMNMSPELTAQTFEALQVRGEELGISRNDISASIFRTERNTMLSQADWANKSPEEQFAYVNQWQSRMDNLMSTSHTLAGKDYAVDYQDHISTLRTAANTAIISRVDDAIDNIDEGAFTSNMQTAISNGALNEYDAGQKRIEFTSAVIEYNADPERVAQRAFVDPSNRGMIPADSLFAPTSQEHTKYSNLLENQLTEDFTNLQDPEAYMRINELIAGGEPKAATVFNREFSRQQAGITSHLERIPNDLNSEAGIAWQQELNQRMDTLTSLEVVGGSLMSQEQRNDFNSTRAFISAQAYSNPVRLRRAMEEENNQIRPIVQSSSLGEWITKNVSTDDATSALYFAGALRMSGTDESTIKDIIESSYTYENLGGDATWSLPARNILSQYGISTPDTQKFAEEVLLNPDSDFLPPEYADRLQVISAGENFQFINMDGMLTAISSTGIQQLPFDPESWQKLREEAAYQYDISNQTVPNRIKNATAIDVGAEVANVVQPLVDNFAAVNPMSTYADAEAHGAAVLKIADGQVAAGDQLRTDLLEGVNEQTASDSYLANSMPNVMELVRLQTGNELTSDQYKQIEAFLIDEGKNYLLDNNTFLNSLLGRPTDGLFEHLAAVGIRYSGADDLSGPERQTGALMQKEQAVASAQARVDAATTTRERVNAQQALRGAEAELEAARSGERMLPRAAVRTSSGDTVRPFYATDAETVTTNGASTEVRIAENNLANATTAVEAARARVSRAGDPRSRLAAQRALDSALAQQEVAQRAFDRLQ